MLCFTLLFKKLKKKRVFVTNRSLIFCLHRFVFYTCCSFTWSLPLAIVWLYCSWGRALPWALCYTEEWNDSMCQCIHIEICFKQWFIWLWIWQIHCRHGKMGVWRQREGYWGSVGPKGIQKQTFSFRWPHSLLRRPYIN